MELFDGSHLKLTSNTIMTSEILTTIESSLKGQVWRLSYGRYHQDKIDEILPLIEEAGKVKNIWLRQNYDEHIIKSMKITNFRMTQLLDLYQNNITSVQDLLMIKMQSLKYLNLSFNRITSIRPLRRTYLGFLSYLGLSRNQISQFEDLVENCSQINHIWIDNQRKKSVITNFQAQKVRQQTKMQDPFKLQSNQETKQQCNAFKFQQSREQQYNNEEQHENINNDLINIVSGYENDHCWVMKLNARKLKTLGLYRQKLNWKYNKIMCQKVNREQFHIC